MVVGELSKGIEDNKQSVEIIKSRPSCKPPQLEAKYSSVIKSSSDITQELRFSGMLEISIGIDSKIDKSNIIEHDEKMKSDNGIADGNFLGKFKATKKRPRQILVKFRNAIKADRLFARATMLKNYEQRSYSL